MLHLLVGHLVQFACLGMSTFPTSDGTIFEHVIVFAGHVFNRDMMGGLTGHVYSASILWNGSIPMYPKQRWESSSPGHEWPGQLVLASCMCV